MQEFEINQGNDPMAVLPGKEGVQAEAVQPITQHPHAESIDNQSYFLGEVPQTSLFDPSAVLPLNSDRLVGSVDVIEKLLLDVGMIIEDEVNSIQKSQKKIAFWEDRIEKNRAVIRKNELKFKQNTTDALYDKKNRDYWFGRSEEVEIDYSHAEVAARVQDWAWLIKKYGLKNADGTEINAKSHCVEELCNGETKNLVAEYRATGNKYELARKEKEAENSRLFRENAQLNETNDQLQGFISNAYANEVEPLQDGILLMKEFGAKLKAMKQEEKATYGDMRLWAEGFLSDFIKANCRVPQHVVIHFRKLSSIPLPPKYC
jgi:hypothetical protein